MEPITIAVVLLYLADKLGSHYAEKILDRADRRIMDALGRGDPMPDEVKLEEYLHRNPDVAKKVERELNTLEVKGVVLPPEGTQLIPADRLEVFAGVLNAILSVMARQQREFASDGFFNSDDAIAVFTSRLDAPGTVSVLNKEISCNLAFTNIYLLKKSDGIPSAVEINEAIRSAAASSTSFVRIRDIKRLSKLRDMCTASSEVRAIHPDFVELGYNVHYDLDRRISNSTDLDELSPELASFLRLSTPYEATAHMLDYLVEEFGKFYLPEEEVRQLRGLALRLAPEGPPT